MSVQPFSYQNLLTKTDAKRNAYWTGQRAGNLFEINNAPTT